MRVIAGTARGTKLESDFDDPKARPTLDRVKESVFSTIQYDLRNARCLDAYACSGSLGIEALSRGAKFVDFCEINNKTLTILKNNIEKTRFQDKSFLYKGDVLDYISSINHKYDFVFLDPPYNKNLIVEFIDKAITNDILSDACLIIAEHEKEYRVDDIFSIANKKIRCIKRKDYSITAVSYIKVEE